jgi:acyl-CoA thioesterase
LTASTDDELLDELRDKLSATPFYGWSGISLESAARAEVTITLEIDERHVNLQGLVHGGVLATMADVAMGLAVRTAVEPDRRHVTIEMGMHYVRPAPRGRIRAAGRAVHVGGQIAYAEADLIDGAGRLLARATGTYSVARERA